MRSTYRTMQSMLSAARQASCNFAYDASSFVFHQYCYTAKAIKESPGELILKTAFGAFSGVTSGIFGYLMLGSLTHGQNFFIKSPNVDFSVFQVPIALGSVICFFAATREINEREEHKTINSFTPTCP